MQRKKKKKKPPDDVIKCDLSRQLKTNETGMKRTNDDDDDHVSQCMNCGAKSSPERDNTARNPVNSRHTLGDGLSRGPLSLDHQYPGID